MATDTDSNVTLFPRVSARKQNHFTTSAEDIIFVEKMLGKLIIQAAAQLQECVPTLENNLTYEDPKACWDKAMNQLFDDLTNVSENVRHPLQKILYNLGWRLDRMELLHSRAPVWYELADGILEMFAKDMDRNY